MILSSHVKLWSLRVLEWTIYNVVYRGQLIDRSIEDILKKKF